MMELVITVCLVCKTSLEKNNMYERNKKVKEKEEARLKELKKIDKDFFDRGIKYVAGIDEAGRGPLAGPVVVAAVIMKPDSMIEGINDSKKISEKKREKLYDLILDEAISYGIGIVDQKEIDEINILQATKKGLTEAIKQYIYKYGFFDATIAEVQKYEYQDTTGRIGIIFKLNNPDENRLRVIINSNGNIDISDYN